MTMVTLPWSYTGSAVGMPPQGSGRRSSPPRDQRLDHLVVALRPLGPRRQDLDRQQRADGGSAASRARAEPIAARRFASGPLRHVGHRSARVSLLGAGLRHRRDQPFALVASHDLGGNLVRAGWQASSRQPVSRFMWRTRLCGPCYVVFLYLPSGGD